MVADAAVPIEKQREIGNVAKGIFTWAQTMMVVTKPVVKGEYNVAAARMFERASFQIDHTLKWNWLWLEPDCVPLKTGWLTTLTEAYNSQPKRFMGALIETDQPGVPKIHLAGCAIYPNCAHSDLAKFCDGKNHFDMSMANYVVPGAVNTPLLFHRWGGPQDPPVFKASKEASDGVNVGTLDMIPREAVLFHRTKDPGLIDLLRAQQSPSDPEQKQLQTELQEELTPQNFDDDLGLPKRRGRPPKTTSPAMPE
jgi:hypothetical protein